MSATVQDPLVGKVLDGRYRVDAFLARGGMATVYTGVDTRLDRPVALKVMHPGLAQDDDFVSRFIREARAAARLSHPNVVAVYDQGADDGHVFLAMEHVHGRTLRDLLRDRRTLTVQDAFEVLEPVLAALGAAHQAGIVHRDVKPENVLLAHDGRVKVADFGLARAVSTTTSHSATTAGVLIGTVAYLSPEQVERGVADPRSDVYAAGILLFEMLTGTKPHDGDSPIQVAYKHVHDDVPAPSTRVPTVPPAVDALVARATSRDPAARPVDADRFLAEVLATRAQLPAEVLQAAPGGAPAPNMERTLVVPMPAPAGLDRGYSPTTAIPTDRDRVRRGDTGPLPVPAPRRRGRRRGVLVLALLALIALAGATWWLGFGPGGFTTTPSLLTLPKAQAEQKAQSLGFSVDYDDEVFSETVPVGSVVSTDPGPRERIRKGATIGVALSKGKERYAVPALRGRTVDEARSLLEENSLTLGATREGFSESVPEGRIASSTPATGEKVKRDTAVQVVVSKGPPPVPVPKVTGQPLAQAEATLTGAGLKVASTDAFDEQVAKGSVVSQDPSAGTLEKGETVHLVVSKGPPLVPVPRVVDLNPTRATAVLAAAGFRVSVRSGIRLINRVILQSPAAGQLAPKGSTVVLSVV